MADLDKAVRRMPGRLMRGCGFTALLVLAVEASANPVPPQSTGQVDPRLQREQLEREQQLRAIEERARRVEVPALQGEAPDEQQLPPGTERFELEGISFNSSVYLQRAELTALAEEYVGREIGFDDLNGLLRRINALYEAQGQLTARAVIPPQTLEDGMLRIVLVEAKVDRLNWLPEQGRVDRAFYERRLGARAGEVLDSPALLNAIQRFNATTPGPQISASLAPGSSFGTTRLDLEAFEPDAWQWTLFANNYGNEGSGREQYGGSLTWFSPSGVADALNAVVVASAGARYGSLRYSRPVNQYNGILYLEASANSLEIEKGPYAALNIEGESRGYGIGYDQPWYLDPQWVLLGGLGYNRQDSETTIEGIALSETTTDEVTLKGQLEYRAAPWYLRYVQRVRQARHDNRISGDSGNYTLLNGDAYAMRPLGASFEAVGRFGWQYATDAANLPAALYYQFGGISSIRGYDSGIVSSPQGLTLNLEAGWRVRPNWRPFVFFDYGRAMELGTADVDLQSAGLGVDFHWGRRVSLSLVAASTLKDVVPDQDSGQVLAQIIIR